MLGVGKNSDTISYAELIFLIKAIGLMTSLPEICGLLHNDVAVSRRLMTSLPGVTSLPNMWGMRAIPAGSGLMRGFRSL